MIRVAINGFGRIGRLAFREMITDSNFDIVAINDTSNAEELCHLLKYDTVHRTFHENEITFDGDFIVVANTKRIRVYAELDPINLPWRELNVDLVLECTGAFTKLEGAHKHIEAGAKKVLISAPGKGEMKTIVFGVNDNILDGTEEVVSAASCTKKGIYARRGRCASGNIIPASTGAASAIGLVIPELQGKLDGLAYRVPVYDGSLVDVTLELKSNPSVDEVNNAFLTHPTPALKFTKDPIVSSDVIGKRVGALVDGLLTNFVEVEGRRLYKVVAWYDNELGYTRQMVETAKRMFK